MDIEEEIRSLQLDSSEDNNGVVNPEAAKLEQIEESDKMDVDLNNEAHKESQSVHVEPSKVKEISAPEDIEGPEDAEGYKKRHLNVVFIGHVDAGKSTTGGQILFLSGQVDDRTIQKYEKEAKDKSRESW